METGCSAGKLIFQAFGRRKVEADFDGGSVISDAGGLLLREVEHSRGFIKEFCDECVTDYRDPSRVKHSVYRLVGQRVFGVTLGYEDVNDHEELRHDPMFMLLVGGDLEQGAPLAGKSTLNRLELGGVKVGEDERYHKILIDEEKVVKFFVRKCIEAHEEEPEEVFIDLDPTDVELHGQQEEGDYNKYYGYRCLLPLYIFLGPYPLFSQLRSSLVKPTLCLVDFLAPIVEQLRESWPNVHMILRADSGFQNDEFFSWVEEEKRKGKNIDFLVAISSNPRLQEKLQPALQAARRQHLETDMPARIYTDFNYRTLSSWNQVRRVVAKAEYRDKGAHSHFIVTSMDREDVSPDKIYEEQYCARGQMENYIKEQLDLFADRCSCHKLSGNQNRMWFSALASLLVGELRRVALAGTELANAQVNTLRRKLFKVGARVRISTRRVHLSLPTSYPFQNLFRRALTNLNRAYAKVALEVNRSEDPREQAEAATM